MRDAATSQLFFVGVPRRHAGKFGKHDLVAPPITFSSVIGAALYLFCARITRVINRVATLSIDEIRGLAPPHDVAAVCLAAVLAPHCARRPLVSLVRLFTETSHLSYEGSAPNGSLIFHPTNPEMTRFAKPLLFSTPRLLRKMIEASSDNSVVFADAEQLIGVGLRPSQNYPAVNFVGRGVWELRTGDDLLIRVDTHGIRLPTADDYETILKRAFKHSFGHMPERRVCAAVEAAVEARHGSLLVFRDAPMAENERSSVTMQFDGDVLPKQVVAALSKIDGAMVFDEQGRCREAGVILSAPSRSTISANAIERGARFNTAAQHASYLKENGTKAVVVVVSEDGYVDIFPKPP